MTDITYLQLKNRVPVAARKNRTPLEKEILKKEGIAGETCHDAPLINVKGKRIGTVTDCFYNIERKKMCVDTFGLFTGSKKCKETGGAKLDAITFFKFNDSEKNMIVTARQMTLQPVLAPSPGMTHVTGAFSEQGKNDVVHGSGRFKNFKATVNFSGGVEMTDDEKVKFDSIFALKEL